MFFGPPLTNPEIISLGFSSDVMAPKLSPISTSAAPSLDAIRVSIERPLLQLVEIAVQMQSFAGSDVTPDDIVCMTEVCTRDSSACQQAAHTTLTPTNNRFITSIPVVAKNLYCSWGSEINIVWIFLGFSQSLHHIQLRQAFASRGFAALYLIEFLFRRIPSLCRNDSMYRSSSFGVRTQKWYPLASALSFRNVLIYPEKIPSSPVS